MSVGIFKNGEYNKVAGNAKDSTAANTTYNNGTSGLQANNVQSAIDEVSAKIGQENISQVGNSVTGAINNLNSNLSKSKFGTNTSIAFDTNFTCPVDGYVRLARSSASGLYLVLVIGNVWVSRLSAANDMAFVYVRKNMVIQSTGSDTDGSLIFYPLT